MEALQLNHQDRRHDEEHQRDDGLDRRLALGALLDRASDRNRITGRQPLCELLHLRRELIHDGFRLHAIEGACLQRDRGKPRSPPYHRLLQFVAQRRDGTERHRLSAQADKLQVSQRVD